MISTTKISSFGCNRLTLVMFKHNLLINKHSELRLLCSLEESKRNRNYLLYVMIEKCGNAFSEGNILMTLNDIPYQNKVDSLQVIACGLCSGKYCGETMRIRWIFITLLGLTCLLQLLTWL